MEVDFSNHIQTKVEEIKRFFEFSIMEDAKFSGAVNRESLLLFSRCHLIYK